MRVSISVQSLHAVDDPREGARRMVDRARAARRAGLDGLYVGDHHATPLPYYQNTPILARMLAEWGDRPAGALYLLPLWHPLIVAEQVGTLASIAAGRFVFQCAIGPDDGQFPAMGVDVRQRPARFEESLALLRRLWNGEVVDSTGPTPMRGARIAPLPPEPVAVWIGAVAKPAIERAARLGDGWLAAPAFGLEAAKQQLASYRDACQRLGRAPGTCVIRRDVYVGASPDEARGAAAPVIARGYRGFPADALVVGNSEQVAESFSRLAALGYDEVVIRHLVQEPDLVLASIERLGEVRRLLSAGGGD